jgi:hypothetical protein
MCVAQLLLVACGVGLRGAFGQCRHADLEDHALFQECMAGPGGGVPQATCGPGNLDANGDIDLHDFALAQLLFNVQLGIIFPHLKFGAGFGPTWIAAGDLDNDGDLDMVAANSFGDSISVLINNGDRTFSDDVLYLAGHWPGTVALGDFDSDGETDIVTANECSDDLSLLLNHGGGTFADALTIDVPGSPRGLDTADLDSDGDLDLVAKNNVDVLVLLNTGNPEVIFEDTVEYDASSGFGEVILADLSTQFGLVVMMNGCVP